MSSAGLSIGELVGTVSLNDLFSGPVKDLSKATGLATESFTAMGQAAGLVGGLMAGATAAIIALGVHGADVADVSSAFDQLTSAAGSTSEAMLGALQEGTLGTLSNFDLMKASNAALAQGFVKSADDAKTLAAGAHLLADRTGGDLVTAFDTLTSAMASGRAGAVKQLGVVIESDKAIQAYANSLHKSVKDLSDHELATAKANAVMAGLKSALDAAGPATVDFGDRINQGKAAIANFTDNLAVAIANSPALAVAMDAIASGIQNAFGGNNQQAIQTISDYVTKFAILLVQAAQVGVQGAELITNAFNGTKFVLNTVLEAVANGVGTVAQFLADFAAKAATAPGFLGDAYKPLVGIFQGVADTAKSMGIGFGEQAAKAVESSNTSTIAFAAVEGALAKVEAGMVAVSGAQVTVATTAGPAAAGAKVIGDTYTATAEQIKAYEAAQLAAITAQDTMTANGIAQMASLQDQISILQTDGITRRLLEIQQAQDAELAMLQTKYDVESAVYQQMADTIREKYGLIVSAAIDTSNQQVQAAIGTNLSVQEQDQQMVDQAIANYARLLASGKATAAQLDAAFGKIHQAEDKRDEDSTKAKIERFNEIAEKAKFYISAIFGHGKIAAIATAIVDTAQAVVKALASAPPPLNYALAAAVGVAGLVQINKIRQQDIGWATGTPGTSFVDFGRGTATTLHGDEAVVTKAQGESVAGMVADALARQDQRTVGELRALRSQMDFRDQMLPRLIRDAMQQAIA